MIYTSARIKKTTKEKIDKAKKKLKLSSDEIINNWHYKSELYDQITDEPIARPSWDNF